MVSLCPKQPIYKGSKPVYPDFVDGSLVSRVDQRIEIVEFAFDVLVILSFDPSTR